MMRSPGLSREPRRIAMVAACPFPSLRGSQVLIRELAHALADAGHEVHLVTYPHGESLGSLRRIFVHRIQPPRFAAGRSGLGWHRLLFDVCLGMTLYRVVREKGIEVIHAHNYEAPIVSYVVRLLTGVPVVYHSHNALSDELGHYFAPGWRRALACRVGRVLDRQVPRRADFSIALTPELEGFLRAHGVAGQRIAVVPPSAPMAAPQSVPACEPDPFDHRFVVMYTGNLDPYQDLDVLFEGFAEFRDTIEQALLVLATHEVNWSRRLGPRARRLLDADALRVIVTPAFPVVRRLMQRADVLVCPRSSWSGFPIKLLNYLTAGRPIVVAEGSAKGIVDGENGLIFRNGDSSDLALALRRLSNDAALRQGLSVNARAAASVFAWHRVVAKIERVYAAVSVQSEGNPQVGRAGRRMVRGLIARSRDRISAASGDGRGSARFS